MQEKVTKKNNPMTILKVLHEDGETKLWIDCLVFDGMAKAVAQHVKKGTLLQVTGDLKEGTYKRADGTDAISYTIMTKELKAKVGNSIMLFDEFSEPTEPKVDSTEQPF